MNWENCTGSIGGSIQMVVMKERKFFYDASDEEKTVASADPMNLQGFDISF